jgi:primosomal replication protein N''
MKHKAIDRLTLLLQQLAQQALQTDQANASLKSHRLIENNSIFSSGLFVTQSDRFIPYIEETQKKVTELSRLLRAEQAQLSAAALAKIELQINALVTALNANNTMHTEAKNRYTARNHAYKSNKYKKITQAILQPAQQLYQKLAEHHGFERRLLDMIADSEHQRSTANTATSVQLSEQVLVLHQRLGRCRKAISTIERDIEFSQTR